MVDNTNRLKNFSIDITTNRGVIKENIDVTSDNLEEIITGIANKLDIEYDNIKYLVIKKMIGKNNEDSERKIDYFSAIQTSLNFSHDKSITPERCLKNSGQKKKYGNICLFSSYCG
jgi:hypothetical protein